MTKADAKRIAELLAAQDSVTEWWDDTLAEPGEKKNAANFPRVVFADISVTDEKDGTRSGWEGDLILPREVVAKMFESAHAYIADELRKLGVEP